MERSKLRCYFAHFKDDWSMGIAIIAHNIKEAKKIIDPYRDMIDCNWYPDLRVNWIKEANIENLKVGIVDNQISVAEAYKRNIYTNLEELDE